MDLPQCEQDIFQDGEVVFITNTIGSVQIENWIVKIREESKQKIDWYFAGGRAVIKTLGDIAVIKKAISNNRKLHDFYYCEAIEELGCFSKEHTKELCEGIWSYNGF